MVYGNNSSSVVTEDYLKGCKPDKKVIPSYASIDEMEYYVIESSENDFNNIMMEAGIRELQYFEETGTEYIYEAKSIKELTKPILDAFKHMWETVQRLINEALDYLQDKAQSFRDKIYRGVDKKFIGNKAANADTKKVFASSYSFSGLSEAVTKVDTKKYDDKFFKEIDAANNLMEETYSKAKADYSANGASGSKVDSFESDVKDIIDGVKESIAGKNSETSSTFTKDVKAKLRGTPKDWTGADVRDGWSKMLDEVIDFPVEKRILKKNYDNLKKQFNKTMATITREQGTKIFEASIFSKAVKGYRTLKQLDVSVEQAVISVINERYNTYRTIMLKLIGSKKVKESATLESSTIDTVDSLFNW